VEKLIANNGAVIFELGFVKLIGHAKANKSLAVAIAKRVDMPPELEPFL
jgi:NDP-sugar pyrophosphorylase family protein